jgi:hypothetical protein
MPASWKPADSVPMSTYVGENFQIVRYQYRIEFLGPGGQLRDTVTFKTPVQSYPDPAWWGKDSASNLLVCTRSDDEYSVQDPEEKARLGPAVGRVLWTNLEGAYSDMCAVFSPRGRVVYRFPRDAPTGSVYGPIGIFRNGRTAAILVGTMGPVDNPEEDAVGNLGVTWKEVWVWEHPKRLRKLKTKPEWMKNDLILSRLRNGTL